MARGVGRLAAASWPGRPPAGLRCPPQGCRGTAGAPMAVMAILRRELAAAARPCSAGCETVDWVSRDAAQARRSRRRSGAMVCGLPHGPGGRSLAWWIPAAVAAGRPKDGAGGGARGRDYADSATRLPPAERVLTVGHGGDPGVAGRRLAGIEPDSRRRGRADPDGGARPSAAARMQLWTIGPIEAARRRCRGGVEEARKIECSRPAMAPRPTRR